LLVRAGPPSGGGEPPFRPVLLSPPPAALRADGVDSEHLCVVNGGLDGIERVLGAHLAGGDAVAVEDPGFSAVGDVVRALGLVALPVSIDECGMLPAALRAALRDGARAVVVTPRGQNPTGAALDARRAHELRTELDPAPAALLVEDDHLGPVAGVPARTLSAARRRWSVVRSTSKWLGPDLRLAVLAGDDTTVRRVEGRQAVGPGWVSTLAQRAVSALWDDEETLALADQAATVYAGRRRALIVALAEHGLAAAAPSGLNVWVPVPDEELAVSGLLAAGWAVSAGARFRLRSQPAIRITTATLEPVEAARVAADLAAVLRPVGRTRAA
ncbi:MAG: aminotransferase class I/II-fold pyridoxal phosphate-dependent enzyme, partial [Solirubrobacteraceae bacterium]